MIGATSPPSTQDTQVTQRNDNKPMAELIGQQGRVSVAELAEDLAGHHRDRRRDLSALERMGLIRRVHGGADRQTLVGDPTGISERDLATLRSRTPVDVAPSRSCRRRAR